ncbi:MAG: PLP-dependent aminotransferase family protein [Caulobacteraceae bacterium]|nr:PLP-dependent aminotransferase family protein [Caulobacteraceae bacterium]
MGTWAPLLSRGEKPIYLAIADAILEDVRTGRLAPGARLPAQRDLAKALGVDFTTVTRGYAEARRRGLISARVGQGTFVTRPVLGDSETGVTHSLVDMSMNAPPPLEDARHVARMWRGLAALEQEHGEALLFRYQSPAGAPKDRAAGVAWLRERIDDIAVERLVVSAGVQAAIVAVLGEVASAGEPICAPALTYPGLRVAAGHLGLGLVDVAMDEEGATPDSFERVCREVGPKAFYCTPTLQNPTTATMSIERRREMARIARRYGVMLVEDDIYGKLPQAPPPALANFAPERTWHIAGLAKTVSPALRIAYVVAPDARGADRLAAGLRALTGMASPITAALATRWIRDGTATETLKAIQTETAARRRIAADALGPEHLACEAFHLWLPLPKGWSRAVFYEELVRRRISVVPSDAFAITSHPPEAVRIGLGAASTREELSRAMERVRQVLDGPRTWSSAIV